MSIQTDMTDSLNVLILILFSDEDLLTARLQLMGLEHAEGFIVRSKVHLQLTLFNVVLPGARLC